MGPKTGSKKDVEVEPFCVPFRDLFRDLFANLPFLLETHGACTRALILRAGAFKMHHFWVPFFRSVFGPVLDPENGTKMGPKMGPAKNRKIAFEGEREREAFVGGNVVDVQPPACGMIYSWSSGEASAVATLPK